MGTYTVQNFTSGEEYAYATLRGAQNKMRTLAAEEFGAEGVAKLTRLIDGYCKEQYPYGAPKELTELKTILINMITDPKFPRDPQAEMDLIFVDENLEIYTLPYDGTLKICVTNENMKTKFPEANVILNSSVAGVLTLDNGRDAEDDPAYVGIDIEIFDEDMYDDDTDET